MTNVILLSSLCLKKKELINTCQSLVTDVANAEAELGNYNHYYSEYIYHFIAVANSIQTIRQEGQIALEKDKKTFKAGAEERTNKVDINNYSVHRISLTCPLNLCRRYQML